MFFFKKYQFGKYTSVVQRFWSRSFMLFWLIESSLLLVFFYLTSNSTQEFFTMFDESQLYKNFFFSWRLFIFKLLPVALLIIVTYLLLLSLKWNMYSKHTPVLFFMSSLLTYIVWLEFYQFFHICNFYGNLNWIYDSIEKIWNLELEPSRSSMMHHYANMFMILKFWHILFVYAFWMFFILSSTDIDSSSYPLLSANLQNFIILYILSWFYMYPWFKFYFSKYNEITYKWFYLNNSSYKGYIFFTDLSIIYANTLDFMLYPNFDTFKAYKNFAFYYWNFYSTPLNHYMFNKHGIKSSIVYDLASQNFIK